VCGCVCAWRVCGREGTRHILLCTDKSCYFINAEDPKKSIWQFPLRGLNRCEVAQGNLVIYLNQSSSANLFEAATTLGTTTHHPPRPRGGTSHPRLIISWALWQERARTGG
jgi:hypothetical protein